MADSAVFFVIKRLGDLLLNEAKFLSGVKGQVTDAQNKLQWMYAFLKDADAHARDGDERVRLWVFQVRENSYALEDVVETYVFKVASKSQGGHMITLLNRSVSIFTEGIELYKVGSKIKKISSNIAALTSNLQTYGIRELRAKEGETSSRHVREQRELRRAYSHVVEHDVVGFHNDIKDLVTNLTEKGNHRVISVCGMGGLGKTTIARKVYHHPEVRKHFDCFAWASISQQCVVRDIWEGILFNLTSPTQAERQEIKNMSDSEIVKKLYNLQEQRKCLVLLDDIWTTSTWDRLKAAFPEDLTVSKILLTTRMKNVALHADQNGFIHEPQFLSENESWELFQNKFSCLEKDPSNIERMEVLGREMLRHCSGLPLAIIVLSGLLSTKHTLNEWEEMKRNVVRYTSKGRVHSDSEFHGVSWVLELSYDELPVYLKPCFLYLAHYPEDVIINVKELCLTLIAEGFISPGGTITIEDVAYNCLSELVERSMVHIENWGLTGRMKTFRIHDLMRDLCLSKAQDENFIQFVDLRNREEEPLEYVSTNTRRVAIYLDDDHVDGFSHFVDSKNDSLRCLVLDNGENNTQKLQILKPVFNHFVMLRVLKLNIKFYNGIDITIKLPKEIGKLIYLRLFSISGQISLYEIPSSIGNLRCLLTLKLHSSPVVNMKVPNVIWKLEQLRHLYLSYHPTGATSVCSKWLRLSNLRNLQTLAWVRTEYLDRNDFVQLTNLKKLKIYVDENLGRIFQDPPIVTFNRLQNLHVFSRDTIDIVPMILSYPQIYKLKLDLWMVKLPQDNQFSPNLIKLELIRCYLDDDPMPTLKKLSSLRVLYMFDNSFWGNEMVCSKGGFPLLESLLISGLTNLKEWNVEEGSLPSLNHLTIAHCKELRRVPDGLRYINTLKEMKIKYMSTAFKERVEEGGEDFYKVEHVPSRVFLNCPWYW